MDEPYILQMRDPWSLMHGEYKQDFIDALREKIGPKHPLCDQEVYAIAVRRNPEPNFHTCKENNKLYQGYDYPNRI